ncbi:putative secreted protein [Actinacidiphila reveromycinica]|uniref:Putative secreted protein n=1 Tax=Actinacidiphila reveromycinica TaxID=659352 RepID=A0A7U3VQS5_9ACTN|nr:putative secreted protein [Streptomyces sp. SN-593]
MNPGRTARRGLVLAAVVVLAAATPGHAYTDTSKTSQQTSGGSGNGVLTAGAGAVTISYPSGSTGSTHTIASVDVNWTPPACWIGPIADPVTFKKDVLAGVKATNVPGQANYALEAMDQYKQHYDSGYTWDGSGKGYKDFNVDQEGKGMFWGAVENPDAPDSLDKFSCNSTIPFFVPNGQRPPAGTPNVITPEMLSKLAYAHTKVPGVTIETNPVDTQTVNLPTWVRLEEKYTPVKVRASVDLGGGQQIWAETTARPTSVHIDPGTSDATVYPASGDCPIAADGTVGADYDGDAAADPPCGVTYLKSTGATGSFDLDVTATWSVGWTGSDGTGGTLPDGRIEQPRQVTVQEIQSVNR